MKYLLVYVLATACNSSDFSSTTADSSNSRVGDDAVQEVEIAAEGLDYTGDPIVLKDPPPGDLSPYDNIEIASSWEVNKVVPDGDEHELNGTKRNKEITVKNLVAKRQNVQSVSQISRLRRPPFIARQRGQNSSTKQESFTQANRGILDILLVIDNSGSMSGEISKVRNNLSSLLSNISNSNWQIAMVKSDPHTSCSAEGLITSKTSNYAQAYTQLLSFNLEGGTEHMLKKSRWALEGKSGTQCDGSWLREGSTVAVIVVSDEPHQCPTSSVCSLSAYRTFISNFGHDVTTYGFTSWNSTNRAIFAQHGSITGDYSSILQKISANIQVNLEDIFTLAATPDGKSMTVKVNNTAVSACSDTQTSNCYKVVSAAGGNAVQFVGYKPPRNANIDIEYTYGGIAFDTEWTLPHDPFTDVNTMTVTVTKEDGTSTTLVRDTDYTLSGQVIRVTSTSVVPQGSELRVDYLENKALQTVFTLTDATGRLNVSGATVVPSTVRVTIKDGSGTTIQTLSSGFSFDGTTLTFTDSNQVPTAGISGTTHAQKFIIAYDYLYGKKASYSFTEHSDHLPNSVLSCHNKTQNSSVSCQHDNSTNTISFTDTSQFDVGDVIVVTEKLRQQGNNIDLSGKGLLSDEPVELELAGKGSCTVPSRFIINNVVVLEDMDVGDCALMQYIQHDKKQMVRYIFRKYDPATSPEAKDFLQMKKDIFSEHYGQYKFEYWKVVINGVRTNKFEIENYRVVLDEEIELGKNSTVEVTVYLYHAR